MKAALKSMALVFTIRKEKEKQTKPKVSEKNNKNQIGTGIEVEKRKNNKSGSLRRHTFYNPLAILTRKTTSNTIPIISTAQINWTVSLMGTNYKISKST